MALLRNLFDKKKTTDQVDIKGLLRALGSSDKNVWLPAVQSLAAVGDNRAIDPLFNKLQKYNDYNIHVLRALGAFKQEDVAQRILSLDSRNWGSPFWEAAEAALVSIGEPSVAPVTREFDKPINEAFKRNEGNGYGFLLKVLRDIGSPSALPTVKRYVQRSIDEGALNSTPIVNAVEYLSIQWGDAQAVDVLVNLVACLVRRFHLVDTAWSQSRSGVSIMTYASIEAFAAMRNQAAIPSLQSIIEHPQVESFEKMCAERALAIITSQFNLENNGGILAEHQDPVCGATPKYPHFKSEYKGITYYFGSSLCKMAFEKSPTRFVNDDGTLKEGAQM